MTLCIAAKCADHVTDRNVVFCFDKRVETDVAGSEVGFKFRKVSTHWVAMLAGQVGRAEELIGLYTTHLQDRLLAEFEVPDELRIPVQKFKNKLANEYVHTMLGISYEDFLQRGQSSLPSTLFENMATDIARLGINCQLILVPIKPQPCKHIFIVDTDGSLSVHNDFAAIGTGGTNAYSWLSYRNQNQHTSIAETIVHILEAKKFAENAPGVGKQTVILWIDENGKMKTPNGIDDAGLANKLWLRFGPRKVSKIKQSVKDEFDEGVNWDQVGIG
jgi:20S proteasome alpha/beta subunit